MKLLAFLLLLPFVGWTQQPPACTWKATATVSGAQVSFPNNTASPICNAFALSWNSTGFSGVSIELQGSDNNASWTTFTGTSTVLVGTNPQTGLTGTIIIQASATLAFIRVNLTSLTGSGSVSYQIYGYNGVTPAAKTGGGGSGGTCAALGGDLSGTCTAANVVKVNGAAVPTSAELLGSNSSGQLTSHSFTGTPGTAAVLASGPTIVSASLTGTTVVPTGGTLGPTGTGAVTANDLLPSGGSAGNGNCMEWVLSGGIYKPGDAGSPCGSSSGSGGGLVTYSSSADTFLGTQFLPPGGGAPASSTESDVQVASPAAATVSNLQVQISSALGLGNSAVFTWRDAGSSTTSTCSISGASATSCSDTTHSFNVAAGDLLDMQVVTTGTPGVVNALFTSAFGTSGVGVTSVTATGPITSSGGTTPNISATYQGNGAKVQASTGSTTTNDCVKFDANGNTVDAGAACGAGSSALTFLGQGVFTSGTACSSSGTVTVTCAATSITFSSIPGTFSGLVLKILARSAAAANGDGFYAQFNGDTGANYQYTGYFINPAASGVTSGASQNQIYIGPTYAASSQANTAGTAVLAIPGYAQTTFNKNTTGQTLGNGNATANQMQVLPIVNNWVNTAAINAIKIYLSSGANFVAGSMFTLYGEQ